MHITESMAVFILQEVTLALAIQVKSFHVRGHQQ